MLRRLLLAAVFTTAVGLTFADEPKKDALKDEKPTLADQLKELRAEMAKVTSEAEQGVPFQRAAGSLFSVQSTQVRCQLAHPPARPAVAHRQSLRSARVQCTRVEGEVGPIVEG